MRGMRGTHAGSVAPVIYPYHACFGTSLNKALCHLTNGVYIMLRPQIAPWKISPTCKIYSF